MFSLTCFQRCLNDSLDEFSFQSFVEFEILRSSDDRHDQSWRWHFPHLKHQLDQSNRFGIDITSNVSTRSVRRDEPVSIVTCRLRVFVLIPVLCTTVDDVPRMFSTKTIATTPDLISTNTPIAHETSNPTHLLFFARGSLSRDEGRAGSSFDVQMVVDREGPIIVGGYRRELRRQSREDRQTSESYEIEFVIITPSMRIIGVRCRYHRRRW